MNFYYQYAVRCPTCNELIACVSPYFINLVENGSTTEEALNEIGLEKWCCRMTMLNPSPMFFNMEVLDVVEGFVSVESNENANIIRPQQIISQSEVSSESLEEEEDLDFLLLGQKAPRKKATTKAQAFSVEEQVYDNIYEGISLSMPLEKSEFETPTIVGISTINNDKNDDLEIIPVGDRKTTVILKGRTFLAR